MGFEDIYNMPEVTAQKKEIEEKIKRFGWTFTYSPKKENKPAKAHTVGLMTTYNHPDICISGVREDESLKILKNAVELIKSGTVFEENQEYVWIDERPVKFEPIFPLFSIYLFLPNIIHYGTPECSVLQLIYQDENGYFPDNEACNPACKQAQKLNVATKPKKRKTPVRRRGDDPEGADFTSLRKKG